MYNEPSIYRSTTVFRLQ